MPHLVALSIFARTCALDRLTTLLVAAAGLLATATSLQAQTVAFHSTAHYNKRVAEFAPLHDIDTSTVVMLGNSLTENGGNWAERLGTRLKVVNRGIIGDNTVGMTERLCQIAPYRPRAIFLMAGINDMSNNLSAQQVAQRVIALIDTIRRQAPQTELFVQSILPINESNGRWKTLTGRTDDIPWANMLIKAYCESSGITYVDIFRRMTRGRSNTLRTELTTDGLHLSPDGYKLWCFELKRHFKRIEKHPVYQPSE